MTEMIFAQWEYFWISMRLGVFITLGYDALRLLRMLVPHGVIFTALEDMVFWLTCTWVIFGLQLEMNYGVIRFFSILAALLGMWLYNRVLGKYLILAAERGSLRLKRNLTLVFKVARMKVMKEIPRSGYGKEKNSHSKKKAEQGGHGTGIDGASSVDVGNPV